MPPKELSAFLAWAEQNEILWDKSAVEIKEGKHGLGIYAKRQLEAGYAAVQVPKAIVLSVETTGIANLLADDEVEGYVGLTIGCMYEMSRGAQSPWSAYLALLAKRLPVMATSLSMESREMMKYCEAYNDIESDITDIVEDYNNVVVPFIDKHPEVFTQQIKDEFFNLEAFKAMNAIVSTRSMDVDNFHVSALVPFADFVNHSQTPNADYLTHEDVCEICGALACEHREYEDDSEGDDDDDKDSDSDEAPDLAGGNDDDDDEAPELAEEDNKSSKEDVQEADASDEDDKWEDEGDSDDEEQEINDTCDIILDDDVEKGEEITRHYGPYPNKILFSKYGFAVEDNTHDTVTIQLEMVRQAAAKILKDDKLVEDRIQWFLESEDAFIGEEDEDDDEDGHEHSDGCCSHDDDGHATDEEHVHTADGGCCGDEEEAEKAGDNDDEDAEEDDQDDEDDDFPRDIMYMMHDGSIDDRLLMLLNVLFMEQSQFDLVKEDKDAAMEYFNDIFMRRQQEEHADESDMDDEEEEDEGEKMPKPELKPRDAKSIMAKLTGPLYYGGLCVQGEKQILQNALQGYTQFYQEL
ncbi:hypothetical protein BGZ98_008324 [Dissophora globulifera]|nr:hypothetical protein BGZ98_008324 [Dissophora globulifera]